MRRRGGRGGGMGSARRLLAAALLAAAVVALLLPGGQAAVAEGQGPRVEVPRVALSGVGHDLKVKVPKGTVLPVRPTWRVVDGQGHLVAEGEAATSDEQGEPLAELTLEDVVLSETGSRTLYVELDGAEAGSGRVRVIPGWLSLLPPLLAIGLALAFRQVVLALGAGVWIGALFADSWNPFVALFRAADHYALGALASEGHASIIIFTLLLGGMVSVITRTGGGTGLAQLVTRRATSSGRGQLATWGLGLLIFFDDYANSLLVGSSMRPITDRLRVSREKLAFLVDATAAPVSSIAIVSSWIGVEVGYIADQYELLGIEGDPYIVFLQTIPYRFYPLLMLLFGLAIVLWRRDFGPMRKAEQRARETGRLLAEGAKPASQLGEESAELARVTPRWHNAIVPIVVVVATALAGMWITGRAGAEAEGLEPTLRNVFGASDSLQALLWGAFAGCIVAVGMGLATRATSLAESLDAWLRGLQAMVLACVILVLAWSLGAVCKEVHTASFIVSGIGDWLAPSMLPAVVFVVAALVSFATGTSWGTMAILFPLVVPMAYELGAGDGHVMLSSIASILAGSVWGDHCSPISDTTIMSSLAASCDHIDHVRTQLPYALLVGIVSVLFGEIGAGLGLYPAWVGLLLAGAVLVALVRFVGRPVADYAPGPQS